MIEIDGKKYLTTEEAAEMIGLPPRTLRWQCCHGKIEGAVKPSRRSSWLIPAASVEKICKDEMEAERRNYCSA
jgi:hypothetical protein